MKIVALTASREEAIYTVELESGLYVDVKSCRTSSPCLIYVMQNEDGSVLYEDDGGDRHPYDGSYLYDEDIEMAVIALVAAKEQGMSIPNSAAPVTACPFCRELEDMKARVEEWKQSPRYMPGYTEEYTAACVNTTYYEGHVTGQLTSRGYTLNFCPVCGKSLSVKGNKPATDKAADAAAEPTDIETLKAVYDDVAKQLDPDGFKLFRAAQNILGKFEYSHFAYEDNVGRFEDADGHKLLTYLLVQYDHKLGEANARRGRWAYVHPCYEECVDLTIDETTPEYISFEKCLYLEVLKLLGLTKKRT